MRGYWCDSTADRVYALHEADSGKTPRAPYSTQSLPGVIPEQRDRSKP